MSLRLTGSVLLASCALYVFGATRPEAAGLIPVHGLRVATVMAHSGDPWSVPQRPPGPYDVRGS